MKLPTEAELIELEKWLYYQFEEPSDNRSYWRCPPITDDQAQERINLLIALARDPSQLLRYVGLDDDAIDKAMQASKPPRKGKLNLIPSVEPKQLGKSQTTRKP